MHGQQRTVGMAAAKPRAMSITIMCRAVEICRMGLAGPGNCLRFAQKTRPLMKACQIRVGPIWSHTPGNRPFADQLKPDKKNYLCLVFYWSGFRFLFYLLDVDPDTQWASGPNGPSARRVILSGRHSLENARSCLGSFLRGSFPGPEGAESLPPSWGRAKQTRNLPNAAMFMFAGGSITNRTFARCLATVHAAAPHARTRRSTHSGLWT